MTQLVFLMYMAISACWVWVSKGNQVAQAVWYLTMVVSYLGLHLCK